MDSNKPLLLKVNPLDPDPAAIRDAVRTLQSGALVILPTETVYGLAADPRLAGAVERIYEAKARDRGKPIPLLASALAVVERAGAAFPPWARRLARRYWPGPLTLVLQSGDKTEGFRVPDHPVALAVLRGAGGLLRVTSANLSGEASARTAEAAVSALGPKIGLALDAGPAGLGLESTVVLATGATPQILRQGALPREAVMSRPRILFVCTGNTCRSPMAEYLFRKWAGPGSVWESASAGVSAAPGARASREACLVMEEQHVDLAAHRSRPLTQAHIDAADIIVVMTEAHRIAVLERFPQGAGRIVLLNAFNPRCREADVQDPIGGPVQAYRAVRDEIEAAMPDLVLHVQRLYTAGIGPQEGV